MRRVVSAAVVAFVLFSAAVYYAAQAPEETSPPETATDPDAPEPKTPSPTTESVASGTLELKARSSHGFVGDEESDRIYATLDVSAGEFEDLERPPLNVALVVDRSGSMRGQKLEYARNAAHTFVDQLRDRDRLTVVSYESETEVDVPSKPIGENAPETFHRAIRELQAGGGTNIERAVRTGLRQLRRSATEQTVDRVVLLSDGKPTSGASAPAQLAGLAKRALEDGLSLTTMGVGLDYNEDLMTQMANVGGGNYYFIDAPDKVVGMFEEELAGLAETVAENASLLVDVGEQVELVEARGYPAEREGDRLMVSLSEFSAGENKSLLLELSERLETGDPQELLGVELSYEDLREDQPAHQTASLTAAATDDPAKVEASIDEEVVSRVQQVKVAKTIDTAMQAFEKGDEQEARTVLQEAEASIDTAQKKYDLSAENVRDEKSKLRSLGEKVERRNSGSSGGKELIKQEKETSNELMLDSTR